MKMSKKRSVRRKKWRTYEIKKRKLRGLPPEEYEQAVKKLAERLKL